MPISTDVAIRCKAFEDSNRCTEDVTVGDMCVKHLRLMQGLEIRKSQIPNGGLGLYTTISRRRGDLIGYYTGTTYDHPVSGDYVINNHSIWIDSNLTTDCAVRFANMAIELANRGGGIVGSSSNSNSNSNIASRLVNNAYFDDFENYKRIGLVVKVPIAIGEEIFADYGENYFTQQDLKQPLCVMPKELTQANSSDTIFEQLQIPAIVLKKKPVNRSHARTRTRTRKRTKTSVRM
jgi:hypothetical protein